MSSVPSSSLTFLSKQQARVIPDTGESSTVKKLRQMVQELENEKNEYIKTNQHLVRSNETVSQENKTLLNAVNDRRALHEQILDKYTKSEQTLKNAIENNKKMSKIYRKYKAKVNSTKSANSDSITGNEELLKYDQEINDIQENADLLLQKLYESEKRIYDYKILLSLDSRLNHINKLFSDEAKNCITANDTNPELFIRSRMARLQERVQKGDEIKQELNLPDDTQNDLKSEVTEQAIKKLSQKYDNGFSIYNQISIINRKRALMNEDDLEFQPPEEGSRPASSRRSSRRPSRMSRMSRPALKLAESKVPKSFGINEEVEELRRIVGSRGFDYMNDAEREKQLARIKGYFFGRDGKAQSSEEEENVSEKVDEKALKSEHSNKAGQEEEEEKKSGKEESVKNEEEELAAKSEHPEEENEKEKEQKSEHQEEENAPDKEGNSEGSAKLSTKGLLPLLGEPTKEEEEEQPEKNNSEKRGSKQASDNGSAKLSTKGLLPLLGEPTKEEEEEQPEKNNSEKSGSKQASDNGSAKLSVKDLLPILGEPAKEEEEEPPEKNNSEKSGSKQASDNGSAKLSVKDLLPILGEPAKEEEEEPPEKKDSGKSGSKQASDNGSAKLSVKDLLPILGEPAKEEEEEPPEKKDSGQSAHTKGSEEESGKLSVKPMLPLLGDQSKEEEEPHEDADHPNNTQTSVKMPSSEPLEKVEEKTIGIQCSLVDPLQLDREYRMKKKLADKERAVPPPKDDKPFSLLVSPVKNTKRYTWRPTKPPVEEDTGSEYILIDDVFTPSESSKAAEEKPPPGQEQDKEEKPPEKVEKPPANDKPNSLLVRPDKSRQPPQTSGKEEPTEEEETTTTEHILLTEDEQLTEVKELLEQLARQRLQEQATQTTPSEKVVKPPATDKSGSLLDHQDKQQASGSQKAGEEEERSEAPKPAETTDKSGQTSLSYLRDKSKPKTEKPKTEKPKTEKPKTEKPKTEKPKTEKPKTEKPPQAVDKQKSPEDEEAASDHLLLSKHSESAKPAEKSDKSGQTSLSYLQDKSKPKTEKPKTEKPPQAVDKQKSPEDEEAASDHLLLSEHSESAKPAETTDKSGQTSLSYLQDKSKPSAPSPPSGSPNSLLVRPDKSRQPPRQQPPSPKEETASEHLLLSESSPLTPPPPPPRKDVHTNTSADRGAPAHAPRERPRREKPPPRKSTYDPSIFYTNALTLTPPKKKTVDQRFTEHVPLSVTLKDIDLEGLDSGSLDKTYELLKRQQALMEKRARLRRGGNGAAEKDNNLQNDVVCKFNFYEEAASPAASSKRKSRGLGSSQRTRASAQIAPYVAGEHDECSGCGGGCCEKAASLLDATQKAQKMQAVRPKTAPKNCVKGKGEGAASGSSAACRSPRRYSASNNCEESNDAQLCQLEQL